MNPNVLTKDGWTALQMAALAGNVKIVEQLLKDPRTTIDLSTDKGTALHCACRSGNIYIAQMLLLNKADFRQRDCFGKLAKEVTSEPRIISLIERYERMVEGVQRKKKIELSMDEIREEEHEQVSTRESNRSTEELIVEIMQQFKPKRGPQIKFADIDEGLNLEKLTGHLGKVRTLVNQRVFVCLNPQLGLLILYKAENHYPTKPHSLLYLSNVAKVVRKYEGWGLREEMFYFELQHRGQKKTFFAENEDSVNRWVDTIRRAKVYHDWIQQVKELRYAEQIGKDKQHKLDEYLNQSLNKFMNEYRLPFRRPDRIRRTKSYNDIRQLKPSHVRASPLTRRSRSAPARSTRSSRASFRRTA